MPQFCGDAKCQQHEPHAAEQSHHPIVRPVVRQGNRAHGSIRMIARRDATECSKRPRSRIARFLVALPPVLDLLLSAKHLFVAAIVAIASVGGVKDALFSPEFWTGPGFCSDRTRRPFPPRYRAPQKRRGAISAGS